MNRRVLVALAVVIPVIVISGGFVMLTSILTPSVNASGPCAPPKLTLGKPEVSASSYGVTITGTTMPGSAATAGGAACSITSILISWGDGSSPTTIFPKIESGSWSWSVSHTYAVYPAGVLQYEIVVSSFQSDGKVISAQEEVSFA